MAIQNNFRVPDCIILAYPALDFSLERFYPSLMHGITDMMLNFNLMKTFRDAYVHENCDLENDPCLSTYIVPDGVLDRFPKVRIMVGSADPLRDQAIKF